MIFVDAISHILFRFRIGVALARFDIIFSSIKMSRWRDSFVVNRNDSLRRGGAGSHCRGPPRLPRVNVRALGALWYDDKDDYCHAAAHLAAWQKRRLGGASRIVQEAALHHSLQNALKIICVTSDGRRRARPRISCGHNFSDAWIASTLSSEGGLPHDDVK